MDRKSPDIWYQSSITGQNIYAVTIAGGKETIRHFCEVEPLPGLRTKCGVEIADSADSDIDRTCQKCASIVCAEKMEPREVVEEAPAETMTERLTAAFRVAADWVRK